MNFVNGWKVKQKGWNKLALKFRIGKITILDLYADFGRKQYGASLFNFGVKADNKKSPG